MNNLRRLRMARNLTQEAAAEAIGTTRNQYVKLETGMRRLSLPWIDRIASAYGIDPGEVVTNMESGMSEADAKFLEEAALYFERRRRDTHGEDMAFWSNVYNAENCRRIAKAIRSIPTPDPDAILRAITSNEMVDVSLDALLHCGVNSDEAATRIALTAVADALRPMLGTGGWKVPDGWKLVPVEPTAEMKKAAFGPVLHGGRNGPITADFLRQEIGIETYKSMLAAAPTPPPQDAIKPMFGTGGWQPIETAPRDGMPLLLCAKATDATDPCVVIGWYLPTAVWTADTFWGNAPAQVVPSHWMPLPTLPTTESKETDTTMSTSTDVLPVVSHPSYDGNLRHQTNEWTPAEHAIRAAMLEVERSGASLHLTNAIQLLAQARQAVARHVIEPAPPTQEPPR